MTIRSKAFNGDPAKMQEVAAFVTAESSTSADTEIGALRSIGEAFDALDPYACRRVLAWAQSRYRTSEVDYVHMAQLLGNMLEAVGAHKEATKQPHSADRALWAAVLKGTKFWTEDDEKAAVSP